MNSDHKAQILERAMELGWTPGQLDWAKQQVDIGNPENIADLYMRGLLTHV